MRTAIHLLLLIGALIGLVGSGVVYAADPARADAPAAAAQLDVNCMTSMQEHERKPAEMPCKGAMLGCAVSIGCTMPAILKDVAPVAGEATLKVSPVFWPSTAVLVGDDIAPEPPPPTLLG